MPAAEVEGVPIGARRFGSAMRPEGQPRSYFVSINTDERDRFSPSLALLCTPGKLSLQLIDGHLSSPRSAGAMRVRVDDRAAITLTARAIGVGEPIAQIEGSPLPLAAVAQVRTRTRS